MGAVLTRPSLLELPQCPACSPGQASTSWWGSARPIPVARGLQVRSVASIMPPPASQDCQLEAKVLLKAGCMESCTLVCHHVLAQIWGSMV